MSIRQRILMQWETYWQEWLAENIAPYQKRSEAQERDLTELLQRCEEVEQRLLAREEQNLALELWTELKVDTVETRLRSSEVLIHSKLCVLDGCMKERFRFERCVTHYERYNQTERFL